MGSPLSVGAYPGETDIQRGKRRIVVGDLVFGALVRLPIAASELGGGLPGVGAIDLTAALTSIFLLGMLALKPGRLPWIVHAALFLILVEVLAGTIVLGGLVPSDLVILWGWLVVIGALIVLSIRAAFLWSLAYLATLVLAVVLPERIEPIHAGEASPAGIAFTIAGVLGFIFPSMAYFVRQRERFQKESDDLLHAILPCASARRVAWNGADGAGSPDEETPSMSTAPIDGGGIYNTSGGDAVLNDQARVIDNTASHDGGGIYNVTATLSLNGEPTFVAVTGNTADADDEVGGAGGGIFSVCANLNGATDGVNVDLNHVGTAAPTEDNVAQPACT